MYILDIKAWKWNFINFKNYSIILNNKAKYKHYIKIISVDIIIIKVENILVNIYVLIILIYSIWISSKIALNFQSFLI